jgi:hypothetical protein
MKNKLRLNPLLLVKQRLDFKWEPIQENIPGLAAVGFEPSNNSYSMVVYQAVCKKFFDANPVSQYVDINTFYIGVIAHEVSHILTGGVLTTVPDNGVFQYLWNVLLDSNNEYYMAEHFPGYAPYIQLVLACTRWANPAHKHPKSALHKDLGTIYDMVRFGVIPKGARAELVNFVLSLMTSSLRGDVNNCFAATRAIYDYLAATYSQNMSPIPTVQGKHTEMGAWSDAVQNKRPKVAGISDQDVKQLAQGIQQQENAQMDLLQNASTGFCDTGGVPPGLGGQPDVVETDDSFFRATVQQFRTQIAFMRRVFMQRYERPGKKLALEGELAMSRQQQAYLDSLTGDEQRNFYVNVKLKPDEDVLLIYDTSGSTKNFQMEYAQAVVMFLAALTGVEGVRQALIEFSGSASLICNFGEAINKKVIRPQSGGGTEMMTAFCIVNDKIKWRGKRRTIFLLTDGDTNEASECLGWMRNAEAAGVVVWLVEIKYGGYGTGLGAIGSWPRQFSSSVEDLPLNLLQHVIGGQRWVKKLL